MMDYFVWIGLIAVVLVVGSLCLTISYQHMKVRESILARAKRMNCSDLKKLEDALDDMLGPKLRALGAATDAEFIKELAEILAK